MPYTQFPTKDPGEVITVTFDFTNDLGTGETITTCVVTTYTASGIDPMPSAILHGSYSILSPTVLQAISGGLDGVSYFLYCLATTNKGNVFARKAMLPLQAN